MENLIIRKLQKSDYHIGYIDLITQLSEANKNIITEDKFYTYLDELSTNQNIFVIYDKEQNKIAGTGSIIIETKLIHNFGIVGHIEDIVIDIKYRGYGLGKMIINFLVDFAKEKKCYKTILTCNDSNLEFYKKCGFSKKDNFMANYF